MEWLYKNINNCYYTRVCELALGYDKATIDDEDSFLQKGEFYRMIEVKPEMLSVIAKEKKDDLVKLYDLLVEIVQVISSGWSNPKKYKGIEYQKLQNDILENINKIVN